MNNLLRLTYCAALVGLAGGCSYQSTRNTSIDISLTYNSAKSDGSRERPIDRHVTADDVAARQATVDATTAKLSAIEAELSETELSRDHAKRRESRIVAEVDDLRTAEARFARAVAEAEQRSLAAREAHSAFCDSVESRAAAAKEAAAAVASEEYETAVAQIKLARQQRDEMRARVGARSDRQSEAQLESIRTRQARSDAEQRFAAMVNAATARLDGERRSLMSRLAMAESQLRAVRQELTRIEQRLCAQREELANLRETVAAFALRLSHLRAERARLIAVKAEQLKAVPLAQTALRQNHAFLAAQSRDEERERQPAAAPSAASRPSAAPHGSTTSTPSRRVGGYHNLAYHNVAYRPPVGNHYVRGYVRKDGTYVPGHRRTNRDNSFWNNWSSYGNRNPYTGSPGTRLPSKSYQGAGATYVRGHYRSNGTYVARHYRRK